MQIEVFPDQKMMLSNTFLASINRISQRVREKLFERVIILCLCSY